MQINVYNELSIEGAELGRVRKLHGVESVSDLFKYEVEVDLSLPLPDLATLMGAPAVITMKDVEGHERQVQGVIAEAEIVAYDTQKGGGGRFVIRPFVYRQSLGRDCAASQDVSILDVIKDVLADYPSPIRFDITSSYPTYPYRVQYREDDWTYLSRLLEEEGIYYWFDHSASSELVFSDDSTSSPSIDGDDVLMFVPRSALIPDKVAVFEASFSSRMAPHVFSGRSFDMQKPGKTIEAKVGSGPHEIYDAPGGGTPNPAILHSRVKVGLEAAHAAKAGMNGKTTSTRVYPGRSFELLLHPIAGLDGKFFVTKVELDGDWQHSVTTSFSAIQKHVPFRPPRTSKEAKQAGLQMGVVVGPDGHEVHPDEYGRVRVQAHWDREGKRNERSGTWCRIAQRGTTGSMLLPRMGWNVAFYNEEGGVDAPSTICRIHDADHPPAYPLPANKTRTVYKTATTPGGGSHNEIYFEDKGGAEEMFIHASRDMHVRALYRKDESIKNDHTRFVGQNYVLHVDAHANERVRANQNVTVGGDEKVTVHDKYSKEVSGNETRTIGGSRDLKVGESYMGTVEGNRNLSVGAAQIDICLGQIGTRSKNNLTMVGGAVVKASGASITDDTSKLGIQLIGGARVDIAKESRPLDVDKVLVEAVGGGMYLKTNAKFLDNADTTASWTALASLDADAPEIWAEAEQKIVIKCGGSSITITTDTIKIEADKLDLSGAHIDADTSQIKHN